MDASFPQAPCTNGETNFASVLAEWRSGSSRAQHQPSQHQPHGSMPPAPDTSVVHGGRRRLIYRKHTCPTQGCNNSVRTKCAWGICNECCMGAHNPCTLHNPTTPGYTGLVTVRASDIRDRIQASQNQGQGAEGLPDQEAHVASQRDLREALSHYQRETEEVRLWRSSVYRHHELSQQEEVTEAVDRYKFNSSLLAELFTAPKGVEPVQGLMRGYLTSFDKLRAAGSELREVYRKLAPRSSQQQQQQPADQQQQQHQSQGSGEAGGSGAVPQGGASGEQDQSQQHQQHHHQQQQRQGSQAAALRALTQQLAADLEEDMPTKRPCVRLVDAATLSAEQEVARGIALGGEGALQL